MPFPQKPTDIGLQSGNGFSTDLVGAWLFTEGTGHTVADYSGRGHHLSGTGYSDGSWGTDGASFLKMHISRLSCNTDTSDFNHVAGEPWSISFLLRNRGGGGTFQRIASRPANVVDMAFQGNDDFGFGFFNGSAWVNKISSGASGACDWWHITHAANNTMKVYRNAEEVYSGSQAIGNTGALDFAAAPGADLPADEYFGGDFAAIFYHRRALSAGDVASHYSAPFAGFSIPPNPEPPQRPEAAVWVGSVTSRNANYFNRNASRLPRFDGSPRFI